MTIYNYSALKNNNEVVQGKIEAEDVKMAREEIRKLGLLPTKVFEEGQKASAQRLGLVHCLCRS